VLPAGEHARSQPQGSILQSHGGVGRDHIDVVGLDHSAVGYFLHRDLGGTRQNAPESARVLGIEVLDQHIRHAGLFRQLVEKFGEGFEASGGRTDADDGEGRCIAVAGRVRLAVPRFHFQNGSFHAHRLGRTSSAEQASPAARTNKMSADG
jgi:hypothetical protein